MSGIVNVSSGWHAVDDNAAEVARYLETASRMLAGMKRKSLDMLKLSNGVSVLDVGCGLGHDAEAILAEIGGKGRVVAAGADLLGPDLARDVDQDAAAVAFAVDVAGAVQHLLERDERALDRRVRGDRVALDGGVESARILVLDRGGRPKRTVGLGW